MSKHALTPEQVAALVQFNLVAARANLQRWQDGLHAIRRIYGERDFATRYAANQLYNALDSVWVWQQLAKRYPTRSPSRERATNRA